MSSHSTPTTRCGRARIRSRQRKHDSPNSSIHHAPAGIDVLDALHAVERLDIASQGYGVKAFTLSMVRAAIDMTEGAVPTSVIREVVEIGASMLVEPVHLLPHVPEVLDRVSRVTRIVMITKGDLVHQTRKVTTSGLEHHFSDIEIVLEKDAEIYTKLLAGFGVDAERFCMVGNSVRSDVLPVMAIGAHAIHIPVPPDVGPRTRGRPRRGRRRTRVHRRPPRLARRRLTAHPPFDCVRSRDRHATTLEAAELNTVDPVVLAFAQDQRRAVACRCDVLTQVAAVDLAPDACGPSRLPRHRSDRRSCGRSCRGPGTPTRGA